MAGTLVSWVKSAYNYIRLARTVHHKYTDMCKRRNDVIYMGSMIAKRNEVLQEVDAKMNVCHSQLQVSPSFVPPPDLFVLSPLISIININPL